MKIHLCSKQANGNVAVKVETTAQRDPIAFQRGKLTTSRNSQSSTSRQIELAEAYADLTSSGGAHFFIILC